MTRYSSLDTRDLSHEDTDEDFTPCDCHGRDVDAFMECSIPADSLSDYFIALCRDVDARMLSSSRESSAHTHTVSEFAFNLACDVARDMQRARFDEAVTRYMRTHVDGAHVGVMHARVIRPHE